MSEDQLIDSIIDDFSELLFSENILHNSNAGVSEQEKSDLIIETDTWFDGILVNDKKENPNDNSVNFNVKYYAKNQNIK